MQLTFALDYDGTFTAAPDIFSKFVLDCQSKGHTVICVTARRDSEETRESMNAIFKHFGFKIRIEFCNLKSKFDTMQERGIKIDIWIDDSPHALLFNY
jgi:UDP-N-acetylmuramate-alanine ligase